MLSIHSIDILVVLFPYVHANNQFVRQEPHCSCNFSVLKQLHAVITVIYLVCASRETAVLFFIPSGLLVAMVTSSVRSVLQFFPLSSHVSFFPSGSGTMISSLTPMATAVEALVIYLVVGVVIKFVGTPLEICLLFL